MYTLSKRKETIPLSPAESAARDRLEAVFGLVGLQLERLSDGTGTLGLHRLVVGA